MQSDTKQHKAKRRNAKQCEATQSIAKRHNAKQCKAMQRDIKLTTESAQQVFSMIFGRGTSMGGSRNQPERVPRGTRAGARLVQLTDYFGTQLEPL